MQNIKHFKLKSVSGALLSCFILLTMPFSETLADDVYSQQTAESSASTSEYLKNFGLYFGYDLAVAPSPTPGTATPDIDTILQNQASSVAGLIGIIPLIADSTFSSIIPNNTSVSLPAGYETINYFLNILPHAIYTNYASPSSTRISVNANIDQKDYFADPISQSIYNTLTTPDYTYCTSDNTSSGTLKTDCDYLDQYKVMQNILEAGDYAANLPGVTDVVSPAYNKPLVSQLNAETLLGPLLYNTQASNGNSTSSSSAEESSGTGLSAETQAVQAANFVRYLSQQIIPMSLASYQNYSNTLNNANNTSLDMSTRNEARNSLYNYLTKLRSYAALKSVGESNLYSMLGKRTLNPKTNSSQAYDEYIMATRRLFNPSTTSVSGANTNSDTTSQWTKDMEKASSITLMRETVYLLAEINYQLYLTRLQEERLLMAMSAMQLQNAANFKDSIILEDTSSDEEDDSEE